VKETQVRIATEIEVWPLTVVVFAGGFEWHICHLYGPPATDSQDWSHCTCLQAQKNKYLISIS
jgi:hypothetical protein